MEKKPITLRQIRKKVEINIRRLEQWYDDNNLKSPRVLKVLDSLDHLVLDIKEIEDEEKLCNTSNS